MRIVSPYPSQRENMSARDILIASLTLNIVPRRSSPAFEDVPPPNDLHAQTTCATTGRHTDRWRRIERRIIHYTACTPYREIRMRPIEYIRCRYERVCGDVSCQNGGTRLGQVLKQRKEFPSNGEIGKQRRSGCNIRARGRSHTGPKRVMGISAAAPAPGCTDGHSPR